MRIVGNCAPIAEIDTVIVHECQFYNEELQYRFFILQIADRCAAEIKKPFIQVEPF